MSPSEKNVKKDRNKKGCRKKGCEKQRLSEKNAVKKTIFFSLEITSFRKKLRKKSNDVDVWPSNYETYFFVSKNPKTLTYYRF